MRPHRRVRYAVLVLTLLQSGCLTHWQEQRGPVAEVLAAKRPELVRLTLQDSTRLVLRHPTLVGDSVAGLNPDTSVALALARVAHVALRKPGASPPVRYFAVPALVGLLIYMLTFNPLGS